MLKRCSNCKHCGLDTRALNIGAFIHRCRVYDYYILNPFWRGWWCKGWVKDNGR